MSIGNANKLFVPKKATRLEWLEYELQKLRAKQEHDKYDEWPSRYLRSNKILALEAHLEVEKLRNIITELIKEK